MKLSSIIGSAILAIVAAVPATAATVSQSYSVDAFWNASLNTQLGTGLSFAAGNVFSVTADVGDTWSMDYRLPWKDANADGNYAYFPVTQGNLTEWVGKLAGRIGSTYFPLGTSISVVAPEAGELFLMAWDAGYWDNAGSINATVSYENSQIAPVPVPAAGLLLAGALAGLTALRHKRIA